MSWSAVTTTDALALSGSFADLAISGTSTVTTLSPGESAHVQMEFNPKATPADNGEVLVLGSTDGTNYDTEPLMTLVISRLVDPARASFVVAGVRKFKLQARVVSTAGAAGTDAGSTMLARIIQNGISI